MPSNPNPTVYGGSINKLDWDTYFMSMAYLVAMKSKDPSTKIGSVIVGPEHEVLSVGYNGMCRGIDDDNPKWWVKPEKYIFVSHSERNSIYNAARNGIHLLGATLYTQGTPCADCAKAIIQSGIKRVVVHDLWDKCNPVKWAESAKYSKEMFTKCGVKFSIFSGELITKIIGQHDSKIYENINKI